MTRLALSLHARNWLGFLKIFKLQDRRSLIILPKMSLGVNSGSTGVEFWHIRFEFLTSQSRFWAQRIEFRSLVFDIKYLRVEFKQM